MEVAYSRKRKEPRNITVMEVAYSRKRKEPIKITVMAVAYFLAYERHTLHSDLFHS